MYQRILVPVAGSDASDRGVDEGIRLALESRATLRFVHVVGAGFSGSADEYLASLRAFEFVGRRVVERARRRAASAGISGEIKLHCVVEGSIPDVIAAEARAWRADVIVMGARDRDDPDASIDFTSERIARASPVPVMTILAGLSTCGDDLAAVRNATPG